MEINTFVEARSHDMRARAIMLATARHSGQKHSFGGPYILHPLEVLNTLNLIYPNDEVLAVAGVLHDVVEDTGVEIGYLSRYFNSEVASVVGYLTREKDEDYHEHILRVSSSNLASLVKLADLKSNLRLGVVHPLEEPRASRLFDRYTKAQTLLLSQDNPYLTKEARSILYG